MQGTLTGRSWIAKLIFIFTLAVSSQSFGQSQTAGEIIGTVTDAARAIVPGAQVFTLGPQGGRTTVADEDGNYRLQFLPPGLYTVTVSAPGLQAVTMEGVNVRLATRSRADVELQPLAEVVETIVVNAQAPTVDTTQTSVNTNLTSDILGKVPTGRSIGAVLDLAPGVVDGGGTGAGNPSISGASGLENSYIVDGVNITNTGYGSIGSYSITYGSLGSGVNFDFIDTVQVKSAGFGAEYGQALGGVVNVITKRGTNELKGSVFSYYKAPSLEADRRPVFLENGNTNLTRVESFDLGFEVGGPVVKDKLFFFAAANPQRTAIGRKIADADPDGDGEINFPLVDLGEQVTVRNRETYAGKLTWNMASNHRLELSLFGDPGRSEFGAQSGGDLLRQNTTSFSQLDFGGHNSILRYEGILSDWMSLEGYIARATNVFAESFPSKNDQMLVVDFTTTPLAITGGTGYYEKNQVGQNTQYQLKATNYFNLAGRHELKYGGAFEDVRFSNEHDRTGPSVTVTDPATGVTQDTTTGVVVYKLLADDGTTNVYRLVRGDLTDAAADTKTEYVSMFLQDQWSPVDTVTLSLGVRAEQQRMVGSGEGAQSYTFKLKDNIAPRVGAAWDFTGRGRGKFYGHYGRFYEKIPNDLAVRSLSYQVGLSRADFLDEELTQQIPEDQVPVGGSTVHYQVLGSEPTQIAPDTKSQYQDEWVLGAEYEVIRNWNMGMRWIHRELGRVLEDYQTGTAEGIATGSEDFGTYVIGNPGTSLNSTCPEAHPECWVDPVRQYDALELTVEKRLSDSWQLLGSYRMSRLFGNYEGLFRNDNGQSDPNITSLFDFPNNTTLTDEEKQTILNQCAEAGIEPEDCVFPVEMIDQGKPGVLPTDRTHVLQVAGSYTSPRGLTFGAVARYQSGTPLSRYYVHPIYENSGEVPVGKRGADGRSPAIFTGDIHMDYTFKMPNNLSAVAMIDVFNVYNNQEAVVLSENVEQALGSLNPDYGKILAYHSPRQVRLGLKIQF